MHLNICSRHKQQTAFQSDEGLYFGYHLKSMPEVHLKYKAGIKSRQHFQVKNSGRIGLNTFTKQFHTTSYVNNTGLPRSGKKFWKMKNVPGQGKVGEFHFQSGKFRKNEKSHGWKSQGISKI